MGDDFIPYGRQSIDEDDVAAVTEVLRGDWLTTGPAVEEFEDALSSHAGGNPAVAVNSGTAALHAAYAIAGVGPGDDILTTPMTFAATATAALHLGADVVFADVEDDTMLLDPAAAREAMTGRTRAVVPVDYAGQPADMDAFRNLADEHGAQLIEDAAHSIGATYKGRPVGDLADLTTFSFHPVKTVTTAEGGAVVARNADDVEPLRRFRNHGLVRDLDQQRYPQGGWHQEIHRLGLNYRLPDVLAALGTSQLAKLDRFVTRRRDLVARYREALADLDGLRLLKVCDDRTPAWHLFPVRILDGRRRQVFDALHDRGIGVQVHYLPVHLHPLFEDWSYHEGMCPVAEQAYKELLSLPLFPDLTELQQDRVITELRSMLT